MPKQGENMDFIDPDYEGIVPVQNNLPPVGYIPMELSTNGRLDVPKKFHVRNFKTSEMLDISLYSGEVLSEKIISVLNGLIYEKVNVGDWPDKCVLELLIRLYVNFFTPTITNVNFPWDESDLEYLRTKGDEEKANSLMEGKWRPETDINLTKIKINNLPANVKSTTTVSKKDAQGNVILKAKFISYPRYGDTLSIKKTLDEKFSETDKAFVKIKNTYELRERYIAEGRENLPVLSEEDYLKWQIYETKKAIYIAQATQALYLVGYNDKDLSKASVSEKIKIIEDPQFDVNIVKKIEKQYGSLNFGIDPEIEVLNPITNLPCKRRFSFRIMDIIQAIQSSDSDGYDISYDEEDV